MSYSSYNHNYYTHNHTTCSTKRDNEKCKGWLGFGWGQMFAPFVFCFVPAVFDHMFVLCVICCLIYLIFDFIGDDDRWNDSFWVSNSNIIYQIFFSVTR